MNGLTFIEELACHRKNRDYKVFVDKITQEIVDQLENGDTIHIRGSEDYKGFEFKKSSVRLKLDPNDTNEYLEFASVQECPKCTKMCTFAVNKYKYIPQASEMPENLNQEYLLITCEHCGYQWKEVTADYVV